jgi:hypothetical protein
MTTPPIALEDRNEDGDRLYSPSAGRNQDIISEWLSNTLKPGAKVLEVGSGTGEHGAAVGEKRPDIIWQYSDPDERSRRSQKAWARDNWPVPLALDLTDPDWAAGLDPVDAIFSANMIHIAPLEAARGLAAGAAKITDAVILYGPFLFGEDSAPSNLDFDRSLKNRDPRWGVREWDLVKHIFEHLGFNQAERFEMPGNNHIVRLSRH